MNEPVSKAIGRAQTIFLHLRLFQNFSFGTATFEKRSFARL
jgi:hypothetical protein